MEDTISRIITDLEGTHINDNHSLPPPAARPPISLSTLEDLQSLLDYNDLQFLDQFIFYLSTKSLSPSSLLPPLTAAMDSAPVHLSLLASKAYLSLLLFPNSPVFTFFTPMAFLSLLRSLRRSLKQGARRGEGSSAGSCVVQAKKRKGRSRNKKEINECDSGEDCGSGELEKFDITVFFDVLERLGLVLDLIHLSRFPDCLKSMVQTVVEIPVLGIELFGNTGNFSRLKELCSRILCQVLKPEHGEEGKTASEVLKSLTPLILAVKSLSRNFALGFVKDLVMGVAKTSDGVKRAVVNLPRYLAQKAQEKAEPRGLAVEAIMEVVKAMDKNDQIEFAGYVVKMTQGKANLRLLGVDLILNLMMLLEDPLGVNMCWEVQDSWGFYCLESLIQRCSDSSAGIRARALSNMAQLVGFLSSDDANSVVIKEAMGFGEVRRERVDGGVNDLLRKRCMDEKANVRRAALLLVSKLIALLGGNFDCVVLKTMGMACSDPLVSIRKAAISALSEVD